jgi:hypothetical protein
VEARLSDWPNLAGIFEREKRRWRRYEVILGRAGGRRCWRKVEKRPEKKFRAIGEESF